MKKKLVLNFKETRDPDLGMLAYTVANKMTDNECFPDPGMLIIELHEITRQFQSAVVDAMSRDMEKVAIKNSIRILLIQKLKQVGNFVITESKGAETLFVKQWF
ncbi:MAG: hypothetical protein ACJ751_12730 [Niastella sp.]|uniref:hypothetical protein n=1 Tax=Niastella sp. TaxID=1869183 RepID=UPI00389A5808